MALGRSIKAGAVVRDIRSGMRIDTLMDKYRITSKGLRDLFRKLVSADVVSTTELDERKNLYESTPGNKGIRRYPRKRVDPPLRIYEEGDPFKGGFVHDISESGLRTKGITVVEGQIKNFIVRSNDFHGQGVSLVFGAKCRWADKNAGIDTDWTAGLEIVDISGFYSQELRKFVAA